MLVWEDLVASLIACYICHVAVGLFGISIKETQKGNGQRPRHVKDRRAFFKVVSMAGRSLEKPVPATCLAAQKQVAVERGTISKHEWK